MSLLNEMTETQEFATLPPVATKILELLENENVDIRDVAKIIETDASLTMKLLRVANSPIYAVRTEINSIQQAILTLGLNRLTNIVLGVSIFSRFLISSQHEAAGLIEKFWWHSSCTGVVAKSLSARIKKIFRDNEFIGGLLHDIGKLVMIQYNPGKYLNVIELVNQSNIYDVDAEEQIYGFNHLQVGEKLAGLWKMPKELSAIISHHSHPMFLNEFRGLAAIVRLADLLCEVWGADFNEGIKEISLKDDESWRVLVEEFPELADMDVEQFTFELESDFKKLSEFLSLITKDI